VLPTIPAALRESTSYQTASIFAIDSYKLRREQGTAVRLRPGLLLLLVEEGQERHVRDLDDLEADTGNITLGLALATEAREQQLVLCDSCAVTATAADHVNPRSHCAGPALRFQRCSQPRTFSSMKLRQPSMGTKAVTFLPFLMSWTRTHLRMAELGCFDSTPTFSSAMPLAWEAPWNGVTL